MVALKADSTVTIEPLFLSEARTRGIALSVGQMNKTDHQGFIRDIGRYEINLEENGRTVTILKQEIAYITAPQPFLAVPPPLSPTAPANAAPDTDALSAKPNIQQEFLDKAIRESHPLTIFLVNGHRIKATVEAYDNFTILLREGDRQHLYYKHAITTINR